MVLNVDALLAVGGAALLAVWLGTFEHASVTQCAAHTRGADAAVVLIGDPQMEGLARVEREGWYGWFNNVLNDHMLRVALRSVLRSARPALVVALGDLFHSQWLGDASFQHIYDRYVDVVARTVARHAPPAALLVNMSGNHDLGYGADLRASTLDRFVDHFGELNSAHELADHLFVVVNAVALDGCAAGLTDYDDAWAHVADVEQRVADSPLPLVLLVHIPLFKPNGSCVGDSEALISWTASNTGVYAQTVLSENTTELLLTRLRPVLVFSGHDHEGCVYRHAAHNVTEYTVRAAQGFLNTNLGVLAIRRRAAGFEYAFGDCAFWHTDSYVALLVLVALWSAAVVSRAAMHFVFVVDDDRPAITTQKQNKKQR